MKGGILGSISSYYERLMSRPGSTSTTQIDWDAREAKHADEVAQPEVKPPLDFTHDYRESQLLQAEPLLLPSRSGVASYVSRSVSVPIELIDRAMTALAAGSNVILYGPPGTGKSTLARAITHAYGCEAIRHTASPDWTPFETVGGIQLNQSNGVESLVPTPGLITNAVVRCLNHMAAESEGRSTGYQAAWLIIDELNRANIDAAFGPYLEALDPEQPRVALPFMNPPRREIDVPARFRVLGTMNTYDKNFLFRMSYALTRRFALIEVSPPANDDVGGRTREGLALIAKVAQLLTSHGVYKSEADLADGYADVLHLLYDRLVTQIRSYDEFGLGRGIGFAQIAAAFSQTALAMELDYGEASDERDRRVEALDRGIAASIVPQLEGLPNARLLAFTDWWADDPELRPLHRSLAATRSLISGLDRYEAYQPRTEPETNGETDLEAEPDPTDFTADYRGALDLQRVPLVLPRRPAVAASVAKTVSVPIELIDRTMTALAAGTNVIFYGPPGTGKTTLARAITTAYGCEAVRHTASADWTPFETAGGLQLSEHDGREALVPTAGIITNAVTECLHHVAAEQHGRATDHQAAWLIIDELNRANIDAAFGPYFDALDPEHPRVALPFMDEPRREIHVPKRFRVIGTMNTYDKNFLFRMSYALTRRFALIEVAPPDNDDEEGRLREGLALLTKVSQLLASHGIYKTEAEVGAEYDEVLHRLYDGLVPQIRALDGDATLGRGIGFAQIASALGQTALAVELDYGEAGDDRERRIEALDRGITSSIVPQLEGLPNSKLRAFTEWWADDDELSALHRSLAATRALITGLDLFIDDSD
jgi:MoxR-like ATPase